jgi:hypothetical protein
MLEFDRNGPPWEGTPEQQTAIRALFDRHAPHGSRLGYALFALDQAVNRKGYNFIPVTFVDFSSQNWLGFTFPTNLQLHEGLHPDWIGMTLFHELGHLIGWHTAAWAGRSCDRATDFQQWVENGQPDGVVADRLAEVVGLSDG